MKQIFKELFTGMYRLYRWPILLVVIVFFSSMLLGSVLPDNAKVYIFQAVGEKFSDILMRSGSALDLSWNIFVNNIVVAGLLYGLGFTIVLALLVIVSNGLIMGLFVSLLYRSETLAPGTFVSAMTSLIPHGIFELSAVFLAGVLSAMVVVKTIFHTYIEPHKTRLQFWLESFLRLVMIVVPLLIIAAWVEVYVSNQLGATVQQWLYPKTENTELSLTLQSDFVLEHNCVPVFEPPDDTVTFNADALGQYATVLYNDAIYAQLRHRATVSKTWQQFIACNNTTTLSLQTWEQPYWSQVEATALEIAILQAMNTDFEQTNGTSHQINYNKLIIHSDQQPDSAIWIFEYNQKTVSIATSDATIDIVDILQSEPYNP